MAVLIAALPAPATHAQKELPALPRDTASTKIIDSLIPWLLNENQQLRGIPFAEVILDTTGKHVLGVDPKNETDQRVIKQISAALDDVMQRVNRSDSTIQSIGRINEVSSHFENLLHELLNLTPGLNCDFPRTADGKCSARVILTCGLSISRANAFFISIQNFMSLEAATVVFAHFISNRKLRPTRFMMTPFISSPGSSTNRGKKVIGTLRAGTLSILRTST
jgi:hypothetical protein